MKSFAAIGRSNDLTLVKAILLYKLSGTDMGSNAPLATVHDVAYDGRGANPDCPVIMPGTPITAAAIDSLSQTLSKAAESMSYLPACVLSITSTRLVWHLPSQRRRIWFNSEAEKYMHLNGKVVTHPALIMDATINSGLRILAVDTDSRPEPDTPVYRAPYMNLYSLGEMCRGNSPMPKIFTVAAMKMFEDSFFKSAFSHTNLTGKALCRHPQGPIKMWEALQSAKKFPGKWLAPLDKARGNRAHHDDSSVKTVQDLLRPQKWTGHHPL